ncbi:quinoprotein relay system zinc metallohydrolase 2 [Methylophaga sp. OBS4]|uniref:quinoprotein relay system zinc metallohydrolase 2 n=1 Tax=Methylophaga sp. OBS4 TaxID=2991935 RepID=UPI002259D4AD|nr:quinoprotein relay system zinc metallohydrolase 2 [Methylophaga sp. OBS4]MCX4188123.1 quinoprotein relay system zinc metallohydrolase 2 [Methylophaga sp. OBS4]
MEIGKFCLALTLALFVAAQAACASEQYQVTQVSDGVFYHQGVHEDATQQNIGAIANVGFIIGDDCVAVIDSGGSFEEGRLLHQALRRQTDKPVCFVINTHVHPDHILGNAAFTTQNPTFIGHEKLPAALAARKDFYARAFSETLGDAYIGTEYIAPQQTVSTGTPLTINLGNRELELTAYTTAHTDHDLTVFDKKTKTLWTGDLLFMQRIPAIDGSINGWIDNIKQLQQLDVVTVVPGHGPASQDQWQQGWQDQLHYLTTIREQIRAIINELGTIDEATATVGLSEQEKWELFEEYHRRNVTASFVELEWE